MLKISCLALYCVLY